MKTKVAVAVPAPRKVNPALMIARTPSPELAAVIGAEPVSRPEMIKRIWAYIRTHNLQNPKNKREIVADDKLEKIFGKKSASMLEVPGLLRPHLKAA